MNEWFTPYSNRNGNQIKFPTEDSDGELKDGSDYDCALNFPHSKLPQFRFILVCHVGHDSRSRALPFRQI